jgi:hypothetical protein
VNFRCIFDHHSGHNKAKWRESSALIGLTEAETEAVIAMQRGVAEDGGSLHVVPVSKPDEATENALKLMLASGYGK